MWYVCIIQSDIDSSYYVGSAHDVPLRVERHNAGWTRSTKGKRPWNLIYTEAYESKSQAARREYQIKRWKSRKKIEELINRSRDTDDKTDNP